jgi:diadenosine tetraphosphate (Ap4A) HIT family hydrolase
MSDATGFILDPRLAADSLLLADGPLSQLRLMDDARFPWLVLVPRVPGAVEWIDLGDHDRHVLLAEVARAGQLLRATGPCRKLNIGALGNVVPQLHVHVVARNEDDAAWPGPVWGAGTMQRLSRTERESRLDVLRKALATLSD